jgi:outer membrane protein OmpA-like peptidoglycan-associated protein
VQKTFLQKHRDQVETVARAYFEVLHDAQRSGMTDLIKADAVIVGEKMDRDAADRVARGIWWKNTVENYAHLKLLPPEETKGLEPVEEMIRKITEVLKQTQEPDAPFRGVARADKLVDDDILRGFYELKLFLDSEQVRGEDTAPKLDDWSGLQRVGSLAVPRIQFSRGKATPTTEAEPLLKALAANLNEQWPRFYLRIEGNTSGKGDPEANRLLAQARARAVKEFLVGKGVSAHRIQAIAKEPGQGSEVQFVVLQQGK